jgi:hypothetical protein
MIYGADAMQAKQNSLSKTCAKLGIAFWDYLGSRLQLPNQPDVPALPQIIKHRCATA